ncbi:hypothetical protein BU17DRAFT_76792 [Hysterangium stoloniferum]|nr:hypothetical protein BU17DRAFT_76792 [Hysterangium stoloniferum]
MSPILIIILSQYDTTFSSPHLLLALPALFAVSPIHPQYIQSLHLSLLAVRRCVQLRDHVSAGMTPELECRAWTAFVELGMKIVGASLSSNDKADGKLARILENEHPSLHHYTHTLTIQHAQLAYWQHNYKFARALLRRHVSTLSSMDAHSHHYSTHLTLVSFGLAANPVDISSALHSLDAILTLSERWGDPEVAFLARVIKLRALVSASSWSDIFPLLDTLETSPRPPVVTLVPQFKSELRASLELHVLALGVLAHIQAGHSKEASKRIAKLHTALDSGVLERNGIRDGVVEVPIQANVPLFIHVTHPRVFFHFAFLLSAVAMRDTTGRRPKPKIFAMEGLVVCERERPKKGHRSVGRYLPWTSLRVHHDVEERLAKIEADLLCELISICIQRSEFDDADEHLARLIAHTRTHQLWDTYNARITLYHAHVAHASGEFDRALKCYRVAAHLAGKEERGGCKRTGGDDVHAGVAIARFVSVAAQAGEVSMRLGIARRECNGEAIDDRFKRWGSEVAKECRALGGTLEAVGRVLEACLSEEIVLAKNHLKTSLNLTTQALDNHLRALVLALVSSHYLHTATDYAEMMLTTARQLAAGLGAPASKSQDPQFHSQNRSDGRPRKVGNAPLGLWVGRRFMELYRRTGRDKRARQQDNINAEFVQALKDIEHRMANHDAMDVDQTVPYH